MYLKDTKVEVNNNSESIRKVLSANSIINSTPAIPQTLKIEAGKGNILALYGRAAPTATGEQIASVMGLLETLETPLAFYIDSVDAFGLLINDPSVKGSEYHVYGDISICMELRMYMVLVYSPDPELAFSQFTK